MKKSYIFTGVVVASLTIGFIFHSGNDISPIVTKVEKEQSLIKNVQAHEEKTEKKIIVTPTALPTQPAFRTIIPIEEMTPYIRAKFAEFGEYDVKIAIALAKSENAVNMHPGVFTCDIYGARNNNGTVDVGLYQINSMNWEKYGGEEAMKDCFKNLDVAYNMRKSWGNWTAWAAYNNKSYLGHMN